MNDEKLFRELKFVAGPLVMPVTLEFVAAVM